MNKSEQVRQSKQGSAIIAAATDGHDSRAIQQQPERQRTRSNADALGLALLDWLTSSAGCDVTWLRVDLSLRQRRETELGSRLGRSRHSPRVVFKNTCVQSYVPALDATVPIVRR